jgi:uncharacterized protein (DUF427 family)
MPDAGNTSADYTAKGGPIIRIAPYRGLVRVSLGGTVVAQSRRALMLTEGKYPERIYLPRNDACAANLERSGHKTHCPWKGDASYFHLVAAAQRAENAVWTYEDPLPAVAAIRGHLAFYAERVDRIELIPE